MDLVTWRRSRPRDIDIVSQTNHLLGIMLPLPNADFKFLLIYFIGNSEDGTAEEYKRFSNTTTI